MVFTDVSSTRIQPAKGGSKNVSSTSFYSDIHGMELPGRTPKHWITNGKLLPTNCTKKSVSLEYEKEASKTLQLEPCHIVGERLCYDLWQRLLPASDLCSTCKQGTIAMRRSAEIQHCVPTRRASGHCEEGADYYKEMVNNIKTAVENGDKSSNLQLFTIPVEPGLKRLAFIFYQNDNIMQQTKSVYMYLIQN